MLFRSLSTFSTNPGVNEYGRSHNGPGAINQSFNLSPISKSSTPHSRPPANVGTGHRPDLNKSGTDAGIHSRNHLKDSSIYGQSRPARPGFLSSSVYTDGTVVGVNGAGSPGSVQGQLRKMKKKRSDLNHRHGMVMSDNTYKIGDTLDRKMAEKRKERKSSESSSSAKVVSPRIVRVDQEEEEVDEGIPRSPASDGRNVMDTTVDSQVFYTSDVIYV